MNALHYGLTPKMKPISPKRSALIAALDIGTSKIACLIARLTPHPPQEVLRRRTTPSRSSASATPARAA
jgi:cell division protein FtsA